MRRLVFTYGILLFSSLLLAQEHGVNLLQRTPALSSSVSVDFDTLMPTLMPHTVTWQDSLSMLLPEPLSFFYYKSAVPPVEFNASPLATGFSGSGQAAMSGALSQTTVYGFGRTHFSSPTYRHQPSAEFNASPFATDFSRSGLLWHSDQAAISAASSQTTLYGLGRTHSSSLTYYYQPHDKWTIAFSGHVQKSVLNNFQSQLFGVSGQIHYQFHPQMAIYAFGHYSVTNLPPFMAHYPHLAFPTYGAAISLQNEYMGANLGVRRYFEPLTLRWETVPIVEPFVKIGDAAIGFDIGRLIQSFLRSEPKYPQISSPVQGGEKSPFRPVAEPPTPYNIRPTK